jgi:hypothetical protein
MSMITTHPYSETIIARIKRDPKFARLLYASTVRVNLRALIPQQKPQRS